MRVQNPWHIDTWEGSIERQGWETRLGQDGEQPCISRTKEFGLYLMNNWETPVIFFFCYKFIYLWLRWVFVAARGLSLVAASRGYSLLRSVGFLLQSTGSRAQAQ